MNVNTYAIQYNTMNSGRCVGLVDGLDAAQALEVWLCNRGYRYNHLDHDQLLDIAHAPGSYGRTGEFRCRRSWVLDRVQPMPNSPYHPNGSTA